MPQKATFTSTSRTGVGDRNILKRNGFGVGIEAFGAHRLGHGGPFPRGFPNYTPDRVTSLWRDVAASARRVTCGPSVAVTAGALIDAEYGAPLRDGEPERAQTWFAAEQGRVHRVRTGCGHARWVPLRPGWPGR